MREVKFTAAMEKPSVDVAPFIPSETVIGRYKDLPIFDSVTESNCVYSYDRIAVELGRGIIDIRQLENGELMIAPGLIYKRVESSKRQEANTQIAEFSK
jgi:hypothetical protein